MDELKKSIVSRMKSNGRDISEKRAKEAYAYFIKKYNGG